MGHKAIMMTARYYFLCLGGNPIVSNGSIMTAPDMRRRPGVVSQPHGWGHGDSVPWQKIAGSHAGVSANDWVDDAIVEPILGQSILNGVPVRLGPCAA